MKCPHCNKEIEDKNTLKIKELNIEVEIEIHDKNKLLSEIKVPKGWRLLTDKEITYLHNSKYKKQLNLNETWEFIKQPFKLNKKEGYVAGFVAGSDWADLNCGWDPGGRDDSLGVRFCKDLNAKGDKLI